MANDSFRYDILAQEALRGVVRSVLRSVEKRGLPGDHHFVVTFDTTAPGVSLSKRLLDRYPQEMTIVIQYQFWGLKVYENAFELGLSFNNVPETLVIPFRAMKSFQDPSVGFMLQFVGVEDPRDTDAPELEPSHTDAPADDTSSSSASKVPSSADPALPSPGAQTATGAQETGVENKQPETVFPSKSDTDGAQKEHDNDSQDPKKGAEVVHLDAFRKK